MKKIKIALLGRPNVGKSSLFNRICGHRQAIVDDAEGTTRDRLYGKGEWLDWDIEVIDTGGMDPTGKALFSSLIQEQAALAVEEAEVLILVVDGLVQTPLPMDYAIASYLRSTGKPVILAVNKIDSYKQALVALHPYYALGLDLIMGVSAVHGYQVGDLLELAIKEKKDRELNVDAPSAVTQSIRVAIVGRTNVGKSTLLNALAGKERSIVSTLPGTTRDPIAEKYSHGNVEIEFVDTAGIRRKKSEQEAVEKFAAIRTHASIEQADVCLLVLDAEQGITSHEKKIAKAIEEAGKGLILILNKWDLVKGLRMEHALQGINQEASFIAHAPKVCLSALEGRNVEKIAPLIEQVFTACNLRISTGELNRFLHKVVEAYHPPMLQGRRLKIYYLSQIAVSPPTFLLFVNKTELMVDSYQKYLMGRLRKEYAFEGVPLVFQLKGKEKKEKEPGKKPISEEEMEMQEEEEDIEAFSY